MAKKKLLLIEDEADIVKVLSKKLNDSGFEVASRPDAMGGTQYVYQSKPDLVLLDLMMPAGGGLAVMKNLTRSTKTSSIPVIVITGMQDEAYKKQVMDMGVKAFIQKPYEFDVLLSEINRALGLA